MIEFSKLTSRIHLISGAGGSNSQCRDGKPE
jgi:hypothetical protein